MTAKEKEIFCLGFRQGAHWAADLIGQHQDEYQVALDKCYIDADDKLCLDYAEISKTPVEEGTQC
jgi:hypothetical protein